MMRATACTVSLALLVSGAVQTAAQTQSGNPAVDSIFSPWDRSDSPGCALGVAQNGRFLYERGYGMANLDYGIANSPRMVYYVGSVSKQFTAASITLLAAQGRIRLTDDVRKYIPELPDYGETITILDLLHHTSGLRDIYVLMDLAGIRMEDVFPDADALALIARQKALNFAPGSDYLYSNTGYWLLGQIVKRVSGESLREYARRQLFQPLGMMHSHFHDDPGHPMPDRVVSYMPASNNAFRMADLPNFDKIGAGGLYTTVEDLLKWDDEFYDGRVGGDAFLRQMQTRAVLDNGDTLGYAQGLIDRTVSRAAHGAAQRLADGVPRRAAAFPGPALRRFRALQPREHCAERPGRARGAGLAGRSHAGTANARAGRCRPGRCAGGASVDAGCGCAAPAGRELPQRRTGRHVYAGAAGE